MPVSVTWSHALIALGAAAGLNGLYQASVWRRHAGHGRGTPGYARARDGRRFMAWSLAIALVLVVLGLAGLGDAPLF